MRRQQGEQCFFSEIFDANFVEFFFWSKKFKSGRGNLKPWEEKVYISLTFHFYRKWTVDENEKSKVKDINSGCHNCRPSPRSPRGGRRRARRGRRCRRRGWSGSPDNAHNAHIAMELDKNCQSSTHGVEKSFSTELQGEYNVGIRLLKEVNITEQ